MLFQIIQIVFWLALATWLGSVMFVAIAAPVIFRTVREADPTLPRVLSVNLEAQHGTLLAGSIVGAILNALRPFQLACAAALVVAIIGQWFVLHPNSQNVIAGVLRSALLVAAGALLIYDWRVLAPRVLAARQEYIDNADEPERANPAKDRFDRLHRQSVTVLTLILGALLMMLLFSSTITPALL